MMRGVRCWWGCGGRRRVGVGVEVEVVGVRGVREGRMYSHGSHRMDNRVVLYIARVSRMPAVDRPRQHSSS